MRVVIAGLLLFLLALQFSCISIAETDPNSSLPSNRPASWEGKSFGVPM